MAFDCRLRGPTLDMYIKLVTRDVSLTKRQSNVMNALTARDDVVVKPADWPLDKYISAANRR